MQLRLIYQPAPPPATDRGGVIGPFPTWTIPELAPARPPAHPSPPPSGQPVEGNDGLCDAVGTGVASVRARARPGARFVKPCGRLGWWPRRSKRLAAYLRTSDRLPRFLWTDERPDPPILCADDSRLRSASVSDAATIRNGEGRRRRGLTGLDGPPAATKRFGALPFQNASIRGGYADHGG